MPATTQFGHFILFYFLKSSILKGSFAVILLSIAVQKAYLHSLLYLQHTAHKLPRDQYQCNLLLHQYVFQIFAFS